MRSVRFVTRTLRSAARHTRGTNARGYAQRIHGRAGAVAPDRARAVCAWPRAGPSSGRRSPRGAAPQRTTAAPRGAIEENETSDRSTRTSLCGSASSLDEAHTLSRIGGLLQGPAAAAGRTMSRLTVGRPCHRPHPRALAQEGHPTVGRRPYGQVDRSWNPNRRLGRCVRLARSVIVFTAAEDADPVSPRALRRVERLVRGADELLDAGPVLRPDRQPD